MNNQKHMTKAERRADNVRKRVENLWVRKQGVKRRLGRLTGEGCLAYYTRKQTRSGSFMKVVQELSETFDRMCAVEGGSVITKTAGGPVVISSQNTLPDDGQGVTIHTPNMVCLDPNCNLPHGNDAMSFQAYQDPAKAESGGNPDCLANVTIGIDPAKPGSDMTAMVFLDEASDITPERAAGLQRVVDAIKNDEIRLPGVAVHSGPRICDLAKSSGVELAQEIEDL